MTEVTGISGFPLCKELYAELYTTDRPHCHHPSPILVTSRVCMGHATHIVSLRFVKPIGQQRFVQPIVSGLSVFISVFDNDRMGQEMTNCFRAMRNP